MVDKTNLFEASNQWASRPPDQRFWTLEEMRQACLNYRNQSVEVTSRLSNMRLDGSSGGLQLIDNENDKSMDFTHFSFGRFSQMLGTPADYMRSLPSDLAAECMNHSLSEKADDKDALLLVAQNGRTHIRAMTSTRYARIWNEELIEQLQVLTERGFVVPPARPASGNDPRAREATEADCLKSAERLGGLGITPGDLIAPAGLYASEKDMFCFMVNEDHGIEVPGKDNALYRGFFCENSEVGDRSLKLTMFLYDAVCGNHIVWGASHVHRFKRIHIGDKAREEAWQGIQNSTTQYIESSTADDERMIKNAVEFRLGKDRDAVVDYLVRESIGTKGQLGSAYDLAEEHPEDGHKGPETAWGMVQGLTRLSQKQPNTDKRVVIDESASKILELVA